MTVRRYTLSTGIGDGRDDRWAAATGSGSRGADESTSADRECWTREKSASGPDPLPESGPARGDRIRVERRLVGWHSGASGDEVAPIPGRPPRSRTGSVAVPVRIKYGLVITTGHRGSIGEARSDHETKRRSDPNRAVSSPEVGPDRRRSLSVSPVSIRCVRYRTVSIMARKRFRSPHEYTGGWPHQIGGIRRTNDRVCVEQTESVRPERRAAIDLGSSRFRVDLRGSDPSRTGCQGIRLWSGSFRAGQIDRRFRNQ